MVCCLFGACHGHGTIGPNMCMLAKHKKCIALLRQKNTASVMFEESSSKLSLDQWIHQIMITTLRETYNNIEKACILCSDEVSNPIYIDKYCHHS